MDLRGQFIKERADKTIMFTPFYANLLQDEEFTESIALKQTPYGTIAFVGSNTVSSFISWRADDVVIDELDSCNQDNLAMVPNGKAHLRPHDDTGGQPNDSRVRDRL
jgi:phage terminase large subunit GpA-like protein